MRSRSTAAGGSFGVVVRHDAPALDSMNRTIGQWS
jgi:hypothetical protein